MFWRFVCYSRVNLLPVRWNLFVRKKIGVTVTQHITKCNKHTFYLQLNFPSFIELMRLRCTSRFISAAGIKDPDDSYLRDERFLLGQAKKGPQGTRHNTLMIESKENRYIFDFYLFLVCFLHYCAVYGRGHEMVASIFRLLLPHWLMSRKFLISQLRFPSQVTLDWNEWAIKTNPFRVCHARVSI